MCLAWLDTVGFSQARVSLDRLTVAGYCQMPDAIWRRTLSTSPWCRWITAELLLPRLRDSFDLYGNTFRDLAWLDTVGFARER